jgi:hypothetical protein
VTNKKPLLLTVIASLLGVIILATGLDSLTLLKTRWFDVEPYSWTVMSDEVIFRSVFIFLVFVSIALIMAMFVREFWRNLLPALGIVGLVALCVLAILPIIAIDTPVPGPDPEPIELPTEEEEELPPDSIIEPDIKVENPDREPGWLRVAVTILVAGTIVALLGFILRLIWLNRPPPRRPLEDLAAEAQAALDSLQSGDSFQNVIIRCYVEMGRILSETRQIKREEAMTPREFEELLIRLGLPAAAVADLTRLFEAARYGQSEVSPAEQKRAVASLEAIIAACQADLVEEETA